MLNFNHLEIRTKKQTHLLHDVSFHFADTGFVSIHAPEEELLQRLAKVLAGIQEPDAGSLHYSTTRIHEFSDDELAYYRTSFMASMFGDCQLRLQESVLDNITMGLDFPVYEIEQLLEEWQLSDKRKYAMEDLSFEDQMKTVLIRLLLRHPQALVFYPASTPFSRKELSECYPLLKKLSLRMLVIVVGDPVSFPLSDRVIELENGYIVSDTDVYQTTSCPIRNSDIPFALNGEVQDMLMKRLNQHFRIKFHVMAILILISFVCLSTSIFSTSLNIVDIQMMFLEQNHYSTIAIEKHAKGNDGTVYPNQFEEMTHQDIKELEKNLKGKVTTSYYPLNTDLLPSGSDSKDITDVSSYVLLEADDISDVGVQNIVGRYPQNVYEVAMNYEDALLQVDWRSLGGKEPERLLYQTVYWFGEPMMITGILMGDTKNNNLSMQMFGYQEQVNRFIPTLGERSLYVVKGFHEESLMNSQVTYRKSLKRMVDSLTSRVFDFDNLVPLTYAMYYYDGKNKLSLGMYTAVASDLESDEVILNFSMALQLGYRETYIQDYQNDNVSEVERIQSFEDFCDKWIGKEIRLQTYLVQGAASNSTIMKKPVKIKGFLYPYTWQYLNEYNQEKGDIYIAMDTIQKDLRSNVAIQETYFHTDNKQDMKKALTYLLQHEQYSAFFSASGLLQFFVVDLKNMSVLLAVVGGASLFISLLLLMRYLHRAIRKLEKEMSVYFLFGETMQNIKKFYIRYFAGMLTRRVLFGGFCGTVILAGFILIIYFKLSMYTKILYNLLLPLVLALLFLLIVTVFLIQYMRRCEVIDEEILRDKE